MKLKTIIELLKQGSFPVIGSEDARNLSDAELRVWDLGVRNTLATIKHAFDTAEESEVWLPIETAPMDGTRVLVGHVSDGKYKNGWLCEAIWVEPAPDEAQFEPGWYNTRVEPFTATPLKPSHWRWMPEAPRL